MSKTYNPREVEQRLYDWWESQSFFTAKIEWGKKPFVIVIPPPNVTGELHHGHAMFIAFEDLMIRWHRMRGEPTLWLPGTDHAGIATQNVVEKALIRQGTSRKELGREEFVKTVWAWKVEYGGIITNQLRRLGASVDWTRERFTMDPMLSRAVREAFVRLFKKGLIYRGPRLVNWCPHDESAISDLEVDHEETQGSLYYVKYPLEGNASEFITVATTRPETMLGDAAVAVNPKDKRYDHLIGRTAILPELGRKLPIIADDAVDMEFGTGAVKITPGHDQTDYEIGERHQLPIINVMNPDASINENGGVYAGLDRFAAREKLVQDLSRDGLLERVEPHTFSVGHCQRCNAIVEPLVSTQWFVKTKPLAKPAIDIVRSGGVKIVPERFTRTYLQWMENIRDWCISRQLWWGHRIPVWYCENGHMTCEVADPARCAVCGSTNIHQDEDVLDTWFSSGLWPFSTLGWPDETEDYRYFYPTSVLETGYDILFFWVARMIMMGLEFAGKPPFHTVFLHGLMRHVDGSKMSKSDFRPGDNPLDIIAEYSADALRFFIISSSSQGNDVRMNLDKVAEARNFANKIWNAARFVIGNLDQKEKPIDAPIALSPQLNLVDRWLLSRLNGLINSVNQAFEDYRFSDAAQAIYHFLWDEYCDWYIEASKVTLNAKGEAPKETTRRILTHALNQSLRLLHPIMPYVTEEIWQHLPHTGPALMVAVFPDKGQPTDLHAERQFERIMAVVRAVRNARSEFNVEPNQRIPAIISAGEHRDLFELQRPVIASLARIDPAKLEIKTTVSQKPEQSYVAVVDQVEVYLPLSGMIDLDKERARLDSELALARAAAARSEKMLASEFATKAPQDVVQRERDRLTAARERISKLEQQVAALRGS